MADLNKDVNTTVDGKTKTKTKTLIDLNVD